MDTINRKAEALRKALAPAVEEYGYGAFDWSTILVALVQALIACQKKPEQLPLMARRPGLERRWMIRQMVIRELGTQRDEPVSAVVKQILKLGAATSERDAKKMFAEAEDA